MNKPTIVRAAIVVVGLLVLGVAAAIVFAGDPDPSKELYVVEAAFRTEPSERNLRNLLNRETDGAASYLKMAIVGRTFASHPAVYEAVARDLRSDLEREWIWRLGEQGDTLFEYYPDLQPECFSFVYRAATWLKEPAVPPTGYETAEIYVSMRQQALEWDEQKIGDLKDRPVWAVLMETGYPEAAVTLVGVADGAASLYFSNGGGIIGAGEHEKVRSASLEWAKTAAEYLKHMTKVQDFPLVTPGNTTFYVLTPSGAYAYTAREKELGEERDKLSRLFHQGHELISQMHVAE